MSFLTPLALVGGLLAVPVVLLYMLRLRRREVPVSSVFLWQQILLDREANTPWQKLKRNLLLLLQLLILAFLVFALARPFIVVPAVSAGQIALLLDASASMNAQDSDDGTRFEEARRRALEMVETMGAQDTMTVIRVASVPEVLATYTGDRAVLRTALVNAQPSNASADWAAALTLAAAGAAGAQDFSIVLLSDGGLGEAATLPAIPGSVELIPIGQSNSNVAITALATRSLPGEAPQLFAQITNYGDQAADMVFDLRVDGELFVAQTYTIPAHGTQPIVSEALPDGFARLQAGLTRPAESTVPDYLPADNSAWAVAPASGARRVLLMTAGNYFVEQVLRSMPGVEVSVGDITRGLPTTEFDLYIFDGWLPEMLPEADMWILNPPSNSGLFTVGEPLTDTASLANPRVRSDNSLMQFVDFDAVMLAGFRPVEASWAEPLISVDGGPLLLAGEVGGRQVAILTFSLSDSDLPLQITWPILVANLLDWYQPQDVVSVPEGLRVGDSLALRAPLTADAIRITLPDGSIRDLPVNRENLVFADTQAPGIYALDVIANGSVTQSAAFAVNLFDEGESDIAPQTSVTLGEVTVAQAEQEDVGQREFWPWLALLALAILLVEWFVYQRRLRPPSALTPIRARRAAASSARR